MFFAPAASIISAAVTAMSGIIFLSFSPHDMLMRNTGMPKMSTTLGSRATKLSKRANASPKPARFTDVTGSSTPSLNARPYPLAFMLKAVLPPPWNPKPRM